MAIGRVCLIVCCVLIASEVQGNITGKFVDRTGQACTYYEARYGGGRGPRGMVITCGGAYSCTYKGNPHDCTWYNKGNQAAFYQCLVADLQNARNACAAPAIACPKKCGDLEMTKQATGLHLLHKVLFQTLETYDKLADDSYGSDDSHY